MKTEKKRAGRPKVRINPVRFMLNLPPKLHAQVKAASILDRRSMTAFVITVLEEKMKEVFADDIDSPGFIPPGLRD